MPATHRHRGFFVFNAHRLALILALWAFSALATAAPDRVALVIGNGSYEIGRLNNPLNDANDMAAALRDLEFDVTVARDLDRAGMLEELDVFRRKIAPGGIALVFYAGHAMEVDSRNWLLPVNNRRIDTQAQVKIQSVSAQDIVDTLEEGGARLNVLILDACRDNPLPAGARSARRGLGAVSTGTSTLVAFSTSPGRTADDGNGRNSPYTAALLNALRQQEVAIPDLFNRAGAELVRSSSGRQIPWKSETPIWPPIALRGSAAASVDSALATHSTSAFDPRAADLAFWQGSQQAGTAEAYKAYLDNYPNGQYAALARIQADRLAPKSEPTTPSTSTSAGLDGSAGSLTMTHRPSPVVSSASDRVVLNTSLGRIVIKLFPEKAPQTVQNFLGYVDSGFYDGTIFHRVIPDFMVQGGGFSTSLQSKAGLKSPIRNEANNGISNQRGTVALARTGDPHSGSSQFFFNLVDNPRLDFVSEQNGLTWGYAVFGEVVEGMNIVDAMSRQPTGASGLHRDVPTTPIVINSARRE
jgi:cyclophilin family peptidyl-prolyl cis-trans isomerase/uncharacterized caspase-like protein